MRSRINNVSKVLGKMKVFSCRAMRLNVRRRLYGVAVMPIVLYGAET